MFYAPYNADYDIKEILWQSGSQFFLQVIRGIGNHEREMVYRSLQKVGIFRISKNIRW